MNKKQKSVKNHTPGKVRYITYWLRFPDNEEWVDQISFVHPLDFELKQTRWWKHDPGIYRDIMTKGEGRFKDQNGVWHIIKIEENIRTKRWGTKGGASKFMA